jgi:hypothetical protein
VEERQWPWSSSWPVMAGALRHNWKPVTHAGAIDRVRPRALMAVRQPAARLGQGSCELYSPTMADEAALCSSERQRARSE